jgi:hypothetical protein
MSEFYRMQKLAGIPITEMRVNEPNKYRWTNYNLYKDILDEYWDDYIIPDDPEDFWSEFYDGEMANVLAFDIAKQIGYKGTLGDLIDDERDFNWYANRLGHELMLKHAVNNKNIININDPKYIKALKEVKDDQKLYQYAVEDFLKKIKDQKSDINEMRVNEPSSLIFKKENEDEIIYIDKKNNVEYYGNILDEDKELMFTIPIYNEPEIMAGYSDENIMDAIESENPDFNINGLRSFISKLKQYEIPILEFYTDSEGGGTFVWVMIILNLNDIKKYIINYSNRSVNEMRVNDPGIASLLKLDVSYENEGKLINYLAKFIDYPDLYNSDYEIWEWALFHSYDEIDPNDIYYDDFKKYSKEEWNKIHDDLENNWGFNYFVRNFTIEDGEQYSHNNDIDQDVSYFRDRYDVNSNVARVMKKLVDDYLD